MNSKKKAQFDLAAKSIEWKRVLLLELSGLNYDRTLSQTSLKPQNPHILENVLRFIVSKLGFAEADYEEALEVLADWSRVCSKPDVGSIEDVQGWANYLCFAVWIAQLAKPEDLPANEWTALPIIDKYLKGPVQHPEVEADEEVLRLEMAAEVMQLEMKELEAPAAEELELQALGEQIKGINRELGEAEKKLSCQESIRGFVFEFLQTELSTLFQSISNGLGVPPDPKLFQETSSNKLAQTTQLESELIGLVERQQTEIKELMRAAAESDENRARLIEDLKAALQTTLEETERLKRALQSVEEQASNYQFEKDELDVERNARGFVVLEMVERDLMALDKHRELLV
jgi:hypothetical protein